MKIIITGNMGYVGPVVVAHLRRRFPGAELIGFDAGYFGACLTTAGRLPEALLTAQHFGDVRAFPAGLLEGADAVVHLAAISNDPMGKQYEQVTDEVNRGASLRVAEMAAAAGVKNFVFASSCSVYGFAEGAARKEDDDLNPLTAYAKSKIETEQGLRAFGASLGGNGPMTVTCLRFATACGMSDRLRLDLVLNDFAACAISSGEISVLSDGTPWRPLIDVADMARAIEWAATRPAETGGRFLVVNAGSDRWNLRVKELADAVAAEIPGTTVSVNPDAPPDRRSYRVDFSLYGRLAPEHQPQVELSGSVRALCEGLRRIGFADRDFRNSAKIRLHVLGSMVAGRVLTADLRWTA